MGGDKGARRLCWPAALEEGLGTPGGRVGAGLPRVSPCTQSSAQHACCGCSVIVEQASMRNRHLGRSHLHPGLQFAGEKQAVGAPEGEGSGVG